MATLPRTGLEEVLKDGSENGGTAADKINAISHYVEDHPSLMRGFADPDLTNGGFTMAFANGSVDFLEDEYVVFDKDGYYDFVGGMPSTPGTGTEIKIGDRYRYIGGVWSPVQAFSAGNKGWFNPKLAGGGISAPLNIINGNTEYNNGDYLIANETDKYDFDTGLRDTVNGEEVNISDRIAYDGATWFVIEASLGLMQGWFNPNVDGGGMALKEPVSNSALTYVYGEYIIAEASGFYDFDTGLSGTASAESIYVGDVYRWGGSDWGIISSPNTQGGMAWESGISYKTGDIVTDLLNSEQYTCIQSNTGNRPSTDVAGTGLNWEILGGPAERGAIVDIAFNTSLEIDMDLSNRFRITLTDDSTMISATNVIEGQGGMIYLVQDATGLHVFDWDTDNTQFVFLDEENIFEDIDPDKINVYAYEVFDSNTIIMSYLGVI